MSDVVPLLKCKYNAFRILKADFEKETYEQVQGFFADDVLDALRKLSKIYLQLMNDAYNRKCENHQEEMFYKGFYEGLISANKIKDEVFGELTENEFKGSDSPRILNQVLSPSEKSGDDKI